MNYKFTIGRRASVEENISNNYEIIDLNTYKASKPIVLVLGGNGTTDDRAANGNAKIVASMLGVFSNDVDLLSVNYNKANEDPELSENCEKIVQNLLLPYVSDNGKRLDIETACKNMRNITIFAHCFGVDGPIDSIVRILDNELYNLKYTSKERKRIISQIFLVAYGSNFNDEIDSVKSVYCLSFSDEMFLNSSMLLSSEFLTKTHLIEMVKCDRDILNEIDTKKSFNSIFEQVKNFLKTHRRVYNIKEDKHIRLFAYGLHQTDEHIWEMDHTIMGLTRDDDWNKHENASSTGDCVSRCLACALCNSVANSIINQNSNRFIDLDMKKLQRQITTICKAHNYEQTKLDGVDLEL